MPPQADGLLDGIPHVRKKRVCAYARVSTDKSDQANSYESQCRYFAEYIRQHSDWQFAGIYADEGISGTNTKKRESFRRMMRDAEHGLIDLILTKEVSRFARNTVDTLMFTRDLKRRGIYVVFLNDNISTQDNDGELRLSIMATIAQDESRKTSERVKWGQKRRMEQGVVFGRDMLGYAVRGGRLILKEDEAETVRLIFRKYTDEGKGTHVIARELQEAGIPPMQVKKWSNTVILRLLRNEKYVGDLCQKKTYTSDYLSHEKKYNRGAEEKVYIRDHHPEIAIIDRPLWDRTQAELERRAPSPEKKSKYSSRYWCSGKLWCGECGGRFVSRLKPLASGGTYRAWRCWEASKHGTPKKDPFGMIAGCWGRSVNDRALCLLTAYAVNLVSIRRERIRRELAQSVKKTVSRPERAGDRHSLEAELESLRRKKIRLIDLAAADAISADDVKEQNAVYTARMADLTNRLEEERGEQLLETGRLEECTKRIDALLDGGLEERGILQEILQRAVIYRDGRIDLYLRYLPFGVRLWYKTTGKLDSFRIEVTEAEMVELDAPF